MVRPPLGTIHLHSSHSSAASYLSSSVMKPGTVAQYVTTVSKALCENNIGHDAST